MNLKKIKEQKNIYGKWVHTKMNYNWGNAAIGRFRDILKYKSELANKKLCFVNPAWTSSACSKCGHNEPKSRENQYSFRCIKCGYMEQADINAAKNILVRGLAADILAVERKSSKAEVLTSDDFKELSQSTE
jgi:putative transposase